VAGDPGNAGSSAGGGDASGGSSGTAAASPFGRCSDTPPSGAAEPPPPHAYSGGSCPVLSPGINSIVTGGAQRAFVLVLPSVTQPQEKLPVVFLWHWLKGEAKQFVDRAEVQKAVDSQRFIGVVPEQKGDLLFTWPVEVTQPQSRIDEELLFFDDLLACVDSQLPVNRSCVASVGVSAGALWTDQLAHRRSEYLSSFMSLSGGVGGLMIKPWQKPARAVPGMVLWGGPTDNCASVFSFQTLSKQLEKDLTDSGSFFLECVHNCGHSEPPFASGVSSKYQGLWDFVLDHPYWLPAGQSPYQTLGIPSSVPEWCGIGAGSAQPRTGACIDGSKC